MSEDSFIVGESLTDQEKEKLKRLDVRLSKLFFGSGFAVRTCVGQGEGSERTVGFVAGFGSPPLVSVSAAEFLATPDDEVIQSIHNRLNNPHSPADDLPDGDGPCQSNLPPV